jgi:O-antigen/teichoic acid export membrane protein
MSLSHPGGPEADVDGDVVDAPPAMEPPAAPSAGHALVRAGWGIADQAIYSLTNLGLTFLVATSVGAEEFGAFASVYVSYLVVYGVVDGSVGEVFAVVYSGTRPSRWRPALRAASGTVLLLAVAVAVPCALAATILGGATGEALLAFALVLPGLLLQALWRTAFFAASHPRGAVANDLVWAVSQLGALAVVLTAGHGSLGWLVGAWGVGALVGALVGMAQLRVIPHLGHARRWLAEHRHLGLRFSSEFLVLYGSSQVVLLALGPWAGLAAVGALRGAQVLFGPIQALLLSMRFALTPIFVRTEAAEPSRLPRLAATTSIALAGLGFLTGLLVLVLPTSVGEALLGDSWEGARTVVPAMTMQVVALGATFGAFTGLRARSEAATTLHVGVGTAISGLALGLAGVLLDGARGAQWGVSLAVAVGAVRLWHAFLAAPVGQDAPSGQGEAEGGHDEQRPEVGHGGLERPPDEEELHAREDRHHGPGEDRSVAIPRDEGGGEQP